jgi:multidrug resistance efflux pump
MTWLRKTRPVFITLGLALGIATLIGARSLTHGTDATAKPDAPRSGGGPVVLGLVDSDPPPVDYRLPPVLASGTVVKVYVKDGDEVRADQPLYEFDTTIQKQDVKRAETAVETARAKVKEAEEGARQHGELIKLAEAKVKAAKRLVELRHAQYKLVEDKLEEFYKNVEKYPESEWPKLKRRDATLYSANVDYETAVTGLSYAEQSRDQLKAVDPQVQVKVAEAAVEQARAELDKAKVAVDLCVVRAKTAGTVEQITIGPGTAMGVATRAPALWLIPAGPRVVRAEIEAEFAHRVGSDIVGKTVTIADHTDPKLTYTGVVRRVPNVFLLKRASADNFLGGDTRVIEAVIEVSDPAPAKQPPLRVGQRVRVNLGQ